MPSHFYSYSFEPRSDWSRTFPARSEIYSYLSSLVEKYNLKAKTRFNSEIESTKFDETSQKWQLFTKSGETLETDIVVTALGQLNRPKVPSIDGQDSFSGAIFHSAEWRHDVSLEGKRVAVIGNGPSAAAVRFGIRLFMTLTRTPYSSVSAMVRHGHVQFAHLAAATIYSCRLSSRLTRTPDAKSGTIKQPQATHGITPPCRI